MKKIMLLLLLLFVITGLEGCLVFVTRPIPGYNYYSRDVYIESRYYNHYHHRHRRWRR